MTYIKNQITDVDHQSFQAVRKSKNFDEILNWLKKLLTDYF